MRYFSTIAGGGGIYLHPRITEREELQTRNIAHM